MGSYTLTGEAETDLETIAIDSAQRWGVERAEIYVLELHKSLERLAAFPDMGRDASNIRLGYMQMAVASHSVFYRKHRDGIIIVRVLHKRMSFEQLL